MKILNYPANKKFAFTLTDDTDWAQTQKVKVIYELMDDIGIKATKTVWVFPCNQKSGSDATGRLCWGDNLSESNSYLELMKDLQKRGHEIALHLASGGNNYRAETVAAYKRFFKLFGHYPIININHGRNKDAIYWCSEAFPNGPLKLLAKFYTKDKSEGHLPNSPYFWGDYCKKYTRYVRGFKSLSLNSLDVNPAMPYHDDQKPYVNYWFSCCDLAEIWLVNKLLTSKNIEYLAHSNGACIGYTYLHRYVDDQLKVLPTVEKSFRNLEQYKDQCYFATASILLDRLSVVRNLKLVKFKKDLMLVNSNAHSVSDVWIHGKPGECVFTKTGKKITIGTSGAVYFESVPSDSSSGTLHEYKTSTLPTFERYKLLMHQFTTLMIRHLAGRPWMRKGW